MAVLTLFRDNEGWGIHDDLIPLDDLDLYELYVGEVEGEDVYIYYLKTDVPPLEITTERWMERVEIMFYIETYLAQATEDSGIGS